MRTRLVPLFLLHAPIADAQVVHSPDPVPLRTGMVVGAREGAVVAFLGIPYAAPPVGRLRWRPPQPPAPWTGVRSATAYGLPCPQPRFGGSPFVTAWSEDCLNLNVWVPATPSATPRPVLVSIPGGGFFAGGSNDPVGGRALAERGVVVVSLNYRLGVFGFLAHPQLAAESPSGTSGNYGLMDQVMALQWIRDNIAAFGGDPKNVTISGSSAGGSSVLYLMVSPLARGLFSRAVAQSAALVAAPLAHVRESRYGLPAQEHQGLRLGVDIAALRQLPADELLKRAQTRIDLPLGDSGIAYWPAVDGHVLPDEPWRLFADGRFARVPLLLGTTDGEGVVFVAFGRKLLRVDEWERFLSERHPGAAHEVVARYHAERAGEIGQAAVQWVNDWWFHGSTRAVARAVSSTGTPTFLYSFTRVSPGQPAMGGPRDRAPHSMEMAYLFDAPIPLPTTLERFDDADRALARAIKEYWLQFAATGDPNGGGRPHWPRFLESEDRHLELGSEIRAGTGLHREALDAFDAMFAMMRKGSR